MEDTDMAKFGGFGGGNMQQLMKQAQKMQQDMAKAQAELEESEVEGTSGGDMVKIVMDGKKSVVSVKLDPKAVDPDDVEMLEDLIIAAFNDAAEKVDALSDEKLGAYRGMI